jgi:uncharacterized membrane protein YkvI|tara:strand:- start:428 stop:1510 length:1083 start_codon:yes stop_codon:yes gene_type:complete
LNNPFFQKYLLPGFIFQSLIIGGGYGTGRELVEFFLTAGPVAGLVNMGVAIIIWSIVLAICFELARRERHYEYRSFIQGLLGKAWISYEVLYLVGLILVVSVMGSASGEIIHEMFGISNLMGIILMMTLVGMIVFFGTTLIEKLLSFWSIILYGVFVIMFLVVYILYGDAIGSSFNQQPSDTSWTMGGIKYAAYNIGLVPGILFCIRHIKTREEAIISGLLAGAIGMIPAVFMFFAMLSQYPNVLNASVPVNAVLDKIGWDWFKLIFQIVLFGTFIETGVGLIHGFNERIASVYTALSNQWRSAIGLVLLIVSIFIANAVGLVGLIAKGYGGLTWAYWIIFVIPVLTIGVRKILKPTFTQ